MSTRCFIGITTDADYTQVIGIYNHFDGYPSYVGKVLVENYKDESKIWELLARGSLSALGPTPKESISYYYDKGRDEEFDGPAVYANIHALFTERWDFDYAYVYHKGRGKWLYAENNSERTGELAELTEEVMAE